MRALLVRLTAVAVLAAASLPLSAQQTSTISPEAKAIVERHVAALGGAAASASVTSMRATGTLAMPAQGITGTVEVQAARPNKTLLRAEISGIGALESGFDGERGWTIDPITGPMLLTGKQLEQAKFEALFDGPFHDLTLYQSLTAAGVETFDGRQARRVNAVTASGDVSAEYFDLETGLHAGSVGKQETVMGPMEVTSIVSDYRKVGGTLQAHKLVQKMMGAEQVITLEKFEFNVVKPETFALPAAIKALIK